MGTCLSVIISGILVIFSNVARKNIPSLYKPVSCSNGHIGHYSVIKEDASYDQCRILSVYWNIYLIVMNQITLCIDVNLVDMINLILTFFFVLKHCLRVCVSFVLLCNSFSFVLFFCSCIPRVYTETNLQLHTKHLHVSPPSSFLSQWMLHRNVKWMCVKCHG